MASGRTAFVFPGQGSQHVGMADALRDLWPAYDEHLSLVERVAGESLESVLEPTRASDSPATPPRLGELIDEGPSEVLSRTEYAQPALLLVSYGWDRVLRERGIEPHFVAGHSLGEYSAMISAGVLGFETGLGLVLERGRVMSDAAAEAEGGMAAVLGLDKDDLDWELLLERVGPLARVEMANINCPGQIVISGLKADVERAGEVLLEVGAKRVVPLTVSGAFHSTLMKPAADVFEGSLRRVELRRADVPIIQNSTSEGAQEPGEILAGLVGQMTGPVLWQDGVVELLNRGVDRFVEVGPGTVLKGLVRRTAPEAAVYAIDDAKDREALLGEAA